MTDEEYLPTMLVRLRMAGMHPSWIPIVRRYAFKHTGIVDRTFLDHMVRSMENGMNTAFTRPFPDGWKSTL